MQFDGLAAGKFQVLRVAVGQVGRLEGTLGENPVNGNGGAELQAVDMRLPSAGHRVAAKALRHHLVAPDARPAVTARERVAHEGLGAEGMVAVAVSIDDEGERFVGHFADRLERHRAHPRGTGVHGEHLTAPVGEGDIGKAVEHRDSRLKNLELAHLWIDGRSGVGRT